MLVLDFYAQGALANGVVGFRLTTAAWDLWQANGISALDSDLRRGVHQVENIMGATFGAGSNPLLLTVCAEDVVAPGVPTCVPNLGLNIAVVNHIRHSTGDAAMHRIARAFLAGYAAVVAQIPVSSVTAAVSPAAVRDQILEATGLRPPADPWEQLTEAVHGLFKLGESPRALTHRRRIGIEHCAPVTLSVRAHKAAALHPSENAPNVNVERPIEIV